MTILSITAGLIQIAPPQMAPWILGILIGLWTIPAHCWMILWSAGCLVIIWFHGALSDLPVSWPSWSNGGLFFFFYSCLSLVPSRMGDLCPVLMGACGYFSMGIHPNPASLHAISAPWEVQSHVYLDNSSSPAQTQLHTNLDLHVHQHLGWEGRRGQIKQIDQTDNLPALVLKCQGHPSHFATSAGQIECPSRCSVSVGADSTDRSRFFICSLSGGLSRSTCLPLFPSEAASLHITAPGLQTHTVMLVL